jgi:hypothetical protein
MSSGSAPPHMSGLRAQLEALLLAHRGMESATARLVDHVTRRTPVALARIGQITHTLWSAMTRRNSHPSPVACPSGRHSSPTATTATPPASSSAETRQARGPAASPCWSTPRRTLCGSRRSTECCRHWNRRRPHAPRPKWPECSRSQEGRVRPSSANPYRPAGQTPGVSPNLTLGPCEKHWRIIPASGPDSPPVSATPAAPPRLVRPRPARCRDVSPWHPSGHGCRVRSGQRQRAPAARDQSGHGVGTGRCRSAVAPEKSTSFGPKPTAGLAMRVLPVVAPFECARRGCAAR